MFNRIIIYLFHPGRTSERGSRKYGVSDELDFDVELVLVVGRLVLVVDRLVLVVDRLVLVVDRLVLVLVVDRLVRVAPGSERKKLWIMPFLLP